MTDKRGLFRKFVVERTDGKSAPGRKHDGCEYFVLDLTHDQRAIPALRAYAGAADLDGDHALATDIYAKVGLPDRTDAAVELSFQKGARRVSHRTKTLTSREVMGVLAAGITPGAKFVAEYVKRLHDALDDAASDDYFGTEGWRKYLLGEDE